MESFKLLLVGDAGLTFWTITNSCFALAMQWWLLVRYWQDVLRQLLCHARVRGKVIKFTLNGRDSA